MSNKIWIFILIVGILGGGFFKFVVVDRQSRLADEIVRSCNLDSNKQNCIQNQLIKSEDKLSFRQMAEIIKLLSANLSGLQDCHELAHQVTADYQKKLGSELFSQIAVDPISCGGGFLHGILASQLSQILGSSKEADGARICKGYSNQYDRVNCAHMLGHIGLYTLGDISRAEKYCQALGEEMLVKHCFSGIFMEYTLGTVARSHNDNLPQLKVDADYINNYERLCEGEERTARDSCYTEAARLYLSFFRQDPTQVLRACKNNYPQSSSDECQKYAALLIATNDRSLRGSQICEHPEMSVDRSKCREMLGFGIVSNSFANITRIPDVCSGDIFKEACVKKSVRRIYESFGVYESLNRCWVLGGQSRLSCLKILIQV